jgi:hypothetical protein
MRLVGLVLEILQQLGKAADKEAAEGRNQGQHFSSSS